MKKLIFALMFLTACSQPPEQPIQPEKPEKPEQEVSKSQSYAFFMRVGDEFVLYKMDDGEKWETGLKVAVTKNEDSPVSEMEEIFGEISPDGKQIAYMQKPAWPHKIFIANIDGSGVKELYTPELPAHDFLENSFYWSENGQFLIFSEFSAEGYPGGGGSEAKLIQLNVKTGEKTTLLSDSLLWSDETGEQYTKIMPVHP